MLPASFGQVNHDERFFGIEVRRRIVERQVAVLADSRKGHIDRRGRDRLAHALALLFRIGRAIQQPCAPDGYARQYPFANVVLEAGRVIAGESNVLVQMK